MATSEHVSWEWRAGIEAMGAEILALPTVDDHVDLRALLEELGKRDIVTLLVEGGGVILGSFFDAHLVDKVHAIIAPLIVGAADAPGAVAGRGAQRMADAIRLRDVTVERLGEDVLVTGYAEYSAKD